MLFRPGDKSEKLYILVNGRIRVENLTNNDNMSSNSHVTEISKPGEILGEISMLTDKPHTHLARVVRDSELVVFSNEGFDSAISNRPGVVYDIIKTIQRREMENEKKSLKKGNVMRMICILPAHYDPLDGDDFIRDFSNRLVQQLEIIGTTRIIRSKTIVNIIFLKS